MPSTHEARIAAVLQELAVEADQHSHDHTTQTVALGRRAVRRRRGLVAFGACVSAAVVAAGGVAIADQFSGPDTTISPAGEAKPTPPTGSPSSGPTTSSSPTSGLGLRAVSCTSVTKPPPDTEVDTLLDAEGGFLVLSFTDPATGENLSFTVAYRTDPECQDRKWLKRLIDDALGAQR